MRGKLTSPVYFRAWSSRNPVAVSQVWEFPKDALHILSAAVSPSTSSLLPRPQQDPARFDPHPGGRDPPLGLGPRRKGGAQRPPAILPQVQGLFEWCIFILCSRYKLKGGGGNRWKRGRKKSLTTGGCGWHSSSAPGVSVEFWIVKPKVTRLERKGCWDIHYIDKTAL